MNHDPIIERLYYVSSLLAISASVAEVREGPQTCLRLTRTLFHPAGGGQKPDAGKINGHVVLDVRKGQVGDAVLHFIEGVHAFQLGDVVTLHVDHERRHLNSAWHTAGHALAAAMEEVEPSLRPINGHHWPDEGRIEASGEPRDPAQFQARLEDALAGMIAADLAVTIDYNPGMPRYVRVGAAAAVPCGGTHLDRLGQLQAIRIRGVKIKKGITRISYAIDLAGASTDPAEPLDGAFAD